MNAQWLGWFFWGIAALFYAYEFFHRVAPSVLTTQLREFFDLDNKQLGTIGAMYLYAYAAFQLPAGLLVDKYGPKKLLLVASLMVTLGSFIFALATNIYIAYFSRFLIGAGSAFAFVGCLKIGSIWLAASSFPLIVGLTNFCGTLGALSGGMHFSLLINRFGWQDAIMIVSFLGLFITLLLLMCLKPAPKENFPLAESETTASLFKALKQIIMSPQTWLIALYGTLLVMPIAAIPEMWGPEYLSFVHGLPKEQASSITHTIFVGTALGGPIIGWIATRVSDYRYIMFPATLCALLLLFYFLYGDYTDVLFLYPVLFFYGLCTSNMLLCFTLIKNQQPVWAQGAAIGFVNMTIMFFGGLTQYGIGWILDHLRKAHNGVYSISDYHAAMSILPFCLIIAISLTLLIKDRHNYI